MQKHIYKNNQHKRKAFTLIELLIVIAIIGILFIVLISKVDFATDKAKATGIQTDFRSFQMAFETVAREQQGFSSLVDGDNYNKLEIAINKNLDNKLHIDIDDSTCEITMSNGAQDPWKTPYHGAYIIGDDGKDRGAIVMYSNGANQEWGSEHSISSGVVVVNVPGNNVYGKDDYSIATIYTHVNGYGEVKTTTTGFSNNMVINNPDNIQNGLSDTNKDTNTDDEVIVEIDYENLVPGLYKKGAISLYNAGKADDALALMKYSWDELLSMQIVRVENGVVYADAYNDWERINEILIGDLVLPNDGSIVKIGDGYWDGDFCGYPGFIGCEYLTGITIPASVIEIEMSAFTECCSLQVVTIEQNSNLNKINEGAFSYCSSLKDIFIPANTQLEYPNYTFNGCTKLRNIKVSENNSLYLDIDGNLYSKDKTILWCYAPGKPNNTFIVPNTVVTLADNSVVSCNYLNHVVVPNSVTTIGCYTFCGSENLVSVSLPDTIQSIGIGAFSWCTNLSNVDLPNSITILEDELFQGCINLINVTLPTGLTHIGNSTFGDCRSLTSIAIPDSIVLIGEGAFAGTALKEFVIPETITSISKNMFYQAGLETIIIHDNVTSIGDSAFWNCAQLKNVVLGANLKTIGKEAFYSCDNLISITIPQNVTSIQTNAFSDCQRLVEVINYSNLSISAGSTANGKVAYYARMVHNGATKIDNVQDFLFFTHNGNNYLVGYVGNDKNLILPTYYNNDNYIIFDRAFYGTNIESVVVPDGVIEIGGYAFASCNSLKTVVLPEHLQTLSSGLFSWCTSLSNINIPQSIKTIGSSTFEWCQSLSLIVLPEGLTHIGWNAFSRCDSLISIVIPSSVNSIGSYAFSSSGIVEIVNNSSVVIEKGTSAYWFGDGPLDIHNGTSKISNVNDCLFYTYNGTNYFVGYIGSSSTVILPENYNGQTYEIFQYAIRKENVTNIVIPESLTVINKYGFNNSNLETITFANNGALKIGDYAFDACSNLKTLELKDSVVSIGYCSFSQCDNLQSLTINANVQEIDDYAFSNCYNLTTVKFNGTIEQWQALYNDTLFVNTLVYQVQCSDGIFEL